MGKATETAARNPWKNVSPDGFSGLQILQKPLPLGISRSTTDVPISMICLFSQNSGYRPAYLPYSFRLQCKWTIPIFCHF